MRVATTILALLLAGAGAAAGQAPPADPGPDEPVPGDRVYTITGGRRIEGTLVALGDSIVIETASGESLARRRPTEIFRHAGHVSAGRGILRGAGIGAAVGFGAGALVGYADGDDEGTFLAFSAEEKALLGGITLGAAGLVVGGIIGAATSGDRWERVALRPVVGAAQGRTGGGLRLGLEGRF